MTQRFSFEELDLHGAYVITPFCAEDERGAFIKDYSEEIFGQNGIVLKLKETFCSLSHKGVVRGMHFQRVRQPAKLIRCLSGTIYDVIVDLRLDSPTFKQWSGQYLSGDNGQEVYVPEGFAHGFIAMEDASMAYKCAEGFCAEYDSGIRWNDSDIGIKWPLEELCSSKVILSEKDKHLQSFKEFMLDYGKFWR